MAERREVFYTLEAQRDRRLDVRIPISTHKLETDAWSDGRELPKGWHAIVTRHSIAVSNKFEWQVGDVEIVKKETS
jgi:hypothetical protein